MSVFRSNAMDNPINWSVKVGRLFAIDIRLHLIFILWAAFQIIDNMREATKAGSTSWSLLGWGLAPTGILFLSVLLHEFGHCFAARRVGGEADQILLWPLGGLAYVQPPHTPRAHFITILWGPMVDVALCLVTGAYLAIRFGSLRAVPLNPLHPFTPLEETLGPFDTLAWIAILVFGINYILTLFNVLLPFYPMDGGQMLHAVLWKRRGYRDATLAATTIGMFGAAAFGVVALLSQNIQLLCLGVFGYLTCYQRRHWAREGLLGDDNDLGYDFSKGFGAFETGAVRTRERSQGFFARRRAARLARQLARERQEAQRRDEEFDRILAKISREGMASLSARERKFLEGETQRRRG